MSVIIKIFILYSIIISCVDQAKLENTKLEFKNKKEPISSCTSGNIKQIKCSKDIENSLLAFKSSICEDGKFKPNGKCIITSCIIGYEVINNQCIKKINITEPTPPVVTPSVVTPSVVTPPVVTPPVVTPPVVTPPVVTPPVVTPPVVTPPVVGPPITGNSNSTLTNLNISTSSVNLSILANARSGIPFAKGVLLATDKIALYSGGHEIPAQTKILSKWNDNSVRWLLVDTQVALTANEAKNIIVKKIENISELNKSGVTTQQTDSLITVNTGSLQVEIPKLNGGIIHRALINNKVVIDAPKDNTPDRGAFISVLNSSSNNSSNFFSSLLKSSSTPLNSDRILSYKNMVSNSGDSKYNLYDPWNLDVKVEDNGPLHSIIRISGTHLNSTGNSFSTFIIRLHFFKNQNTIKVTHSLVYTGDETEQIKDFGLRLPFLATNASTLIEGVAVETGMGEVRHLAYGNYEVNSSQKSGQALGYIGRSNDNVNMSVILRDMAEHFPKALVANQVGIEIQLYPNSISPWNLTKYTPNTGESDFNTYPGSEIATRTGGETTRFTNHYFLRGAQGLGTSNDYLINFGEGALNKIELEAQAKVLDHGPIMLLAMPKHYSDAKVMGVGPFVFDHNLNTSESHFRIDKVMQIARDFMRYSQRIQFEWFGIEDYGDVRGRFFGGKGDNHTWYERGRYGWSGNSGEPSNQLWVQFLRSPDQQTFLDAEALARHTLDQQTVHFATSSAQSGTELDGKNMFGAIGSLHRHGVQAWSGYAGSPDYSHVGGVETYYYLTGDERAKEVLYEQAQFIVRDNAAKTALKNGLDVVDRAAAVFFDSPTIAQEFEAKSTYYLNYLTDKNVDGTGYNPVQTRLIDRANENGIHDRTDGSRTNRELFKGGFEYFMRGAPGILYRHERTGDTIAGKLILDSADILTKGDPKNPNNAGTDDWGLGVDGHAGSVFYHMNTLAYAATIANSLGVDGTAYKDLAIKCFENNTRANINDTNDTASIPLAIMQSLPSDWKLWNWSWQEPDQYNPEAPGILWLDRTIMYKNNFIQDYHSYRAFIHLATVAAIAQQGSNPTTPAISTCIAGAQRTDIDCSTLIANSIKATMIETCSGDPLAYVAGACIVTECANTYSVSTDQLSCEKNQIQEPPGGGLTPSGSNLVSWPANITKFVRKTNLTEVGGLHPDSNLSGITWVPELDQYITIWNGNSRLYLHNNQMDILKIMDTGTGADSEDIVLTGLNEDRSVNILFSNEREYMYQGKLGPLTSDPSTLKRQLLDVQGRLTNTVNGVVYQTNTAQKIQYRTGTDNLGAEGIAYDPSTNSVYLCQEDRYIYKRTLPNYVSREVQNSPSDWGTPVYVGSVMDNYKGTLMLTGLSHISRCLFNPNTGRLLLLSDNSTDRSLGQGGRIIDYDLEKMEIVNHLDIAPGNSLGTNYEGMTINGNGDLVITSEPYYYQVYEYVE